MRVFFMNKLSQKSLELRVEKEVKERNLISSGNIVYVALSGGADSVCLFNILFNLQSKLGFGLKACHFNHKMRGEESYRDQKFVENICQKKNILLVTGQWQGKKTIKNEQKAREARYNFFDSILKSDRGAKVALAHNANDLCETFFMRIIRGAGLSGMRSIPHHRKNFIRPLLPFSRQDILSYLEGLKIDYMIDSSNKDTKYFRNKIRHDLLPKLLEFNPNLSATVAANIEILSIDYQYVRMEAEKKYKLIVQKESKNKVELSRESWLKLHPALRFEVLRVALAYISDLDDISLIHLKSIYNLIEKGEGKKGLLLPHSLHIELKSGKIHLLKISP